MEQIFVRNCQNRCALKNVKSRYMKISVPNICEMLSPMHINNELEMSKKNYPELHHHRWEVWIHILYTQNLFMLTKIGNCLL